MSRWIKTSEGRPVKVNRGRAQYAPQTLDRRPQIVALRAEGMTFAMIGAQLGISDSLAHRLFHQAQRDKREGIVPRLGRPPKIATVRPPPDLEPLPDARKRSPASSGWPRMPKRQ
jgi:hypothetical protein